MTTALYTIENRVVRLIRQRVGAAELRMEIHAVLRDLFQRIINLVVNRHRLFSAVFKRHLRFGAERHLPVAVEAAARVDAHRQRIDLHILLPTHAEEIANGRLHARILLPIPVHAQDAVTPFLGDRTPDVTDFAHSFNVTQGKRLARLHNNIGVHLPACAQITRFVLGKSFLPRRYTALPRLASQIFRGN